MMEETAAEGLDAGEETWGLSFHEEGKADFSVTHTGWTASEPVVAAERKCVCTGVYVCARVRVRVVRCYSKE